MSKLVKPNTYWIGSTVVDFDELKRYLQDTDQTSFLEEIKQAKKEGLNDGEILCSFYAKACYAALTTEKNKNISRVRGIHDNVLGTIKSGHGCYDEKTEVLTKNGWKNWKNVSKTDQFATLNKSGRLEWHIPKKLYSAKYNGEMIRYNSNQVDLLVTPNHNMLACKTSTKTGRNKEYKDYELIKAQEIFDKPHALLKCTPNLELGFHETPNLFFEFLGFSIGDGSIKTHNQIEFNLKKQRKIDYIINICQSINIQYENKNGKISVSIKQFNRKQREEILGIYNKNKEKIIPNLGEYNHNELCSLYRGLINSDGSVSQTSTCYDTTSYTLAGQFQALCNFIGLGCNISQAECYKDRKNSFGNKEIYRCIVVSRNKKPEFNKSSAAQYPKTKKEEYVGMIYCAEVANHTLYVRRNGKAVWCGNSVFEHCNLNFMIRDCSRVFTHELVRHRVGTAFSQTSGRYVRTDSINLVYDPILDPVKDEISKTLELIESQYKKIEEKIGVNEMKDFTQKKKVTSALRRILPNGQSNEIGFSVNLRSLRHTITMRTSRHAEWEIRVIFNQIFDLVKDKYPAIFVDAKIEEIDGLNEIVFEYEKI